MSQVDETFFTIVGCMDGRVQEARIKLGREKFGTHYPDTITDAGIAGLIVDQDPKFLEGLKKKLLISLDKHNSKGILVSGHQECAGNPVPDEEHKDDVRKSAQIVGDLIDHRVPVVSIFVSRDGDSWRAEEI